MSHAVTIVVDAGTSAPASKGTPFEVFGTGARRQPADIITSAAAARIVTQARARIIVPYVSAGVTMLREG